MTRTKSPVYTKSVKNINYNLCQHNKLLLICSSNSSRTHNYCGN